MDDKLQEDEETDVVNNPVLVAATQFADTDDCDVLLYTGDIDRGYDDMLLDMLMRMRRRSNVLLLLCSHGGNPDAAYRIARGLQENYTKFTVLLAGCCKSAGTLLVLGAELGPLDIQLRKKDELFETDSGLTVLNALSELESKAFVLFEKTFLKIKLRSGGLVTFKTATHIATELAKGVVSPIMAQIDPMHIGEVSRALKIGKDYGQRLSAISGNLHDGALDRLVEEYPSHGFVIDRREAKELFVSVRKLNAAEEALVTLNPLKGTIRIPKNDDPMFTFLSSTRKDDQDDKSVSSDTQDLGEGEPPTGTGTANDEEIIGSEESSRPRAVRGVNGARTRAIS